MSRDYQISRRLFVDARITAGSECHCDKSQANYLLNVLRLKAKDTLCVFNGRDGEWRAEITEASRKRCILKFLEQIHPQENGPNIDYLFAPLKRARLDYMVQKATEMGVARLQPVITARTNVARVKIERMRANAVEAAEQCGVLRIPDVREPVKLPALLEAWDGRRPLIYCDEMAAPSSPLDALRALKPGPLALLIGPEGGFDEREREMLCDCDFVMALSLGPRVMRADTAAVAALALVNSVLGDWS